MRDVFSDLARQYPSALFLCVDIDEVPEAAERHSILRVPSYACFWCGAKEVEFAGCSARKLKETLLNCIELGPDVAWRSLGSSKVEAMQKSRVEAERRYRLDKDQRARGGAPEDQRARGDAPEDQRGSGDLALRFQELAAQWSNKCRTPPEWEEMKLRAQHERELRAASEREASALEALKSAQSQFERLEAQRRRQHLETEEARRQAEVEAEQRARDVEDLRQTLEAQAEAHRLAAEEADRRREEAERNARADAARLERLLKLQEDQRALFRKIRDIELRGNVLFDPSTGRLSVQPGRLQFKSRVLGNERKDAPIAEFDDKRSAQVVLQDIAHLLALYKTAAEVTHTDRENVAGGRYDSKKETWCRALAQSKAELIRDALSALAVTEGQLTATSRLADKEQTVIEIDVREQHSPSIEEDLEPGSQSQCAMLEAELPLDAEPEQM